MSRAVHGLILWIFVVGAIAGRLHAQPSGPLVPPAFEVSEPVRSMLALPFLTDAERAELRVFHGIWTESDLVDPVHRARALLQVGRFDDPRLADPALPILLRAEALMGSGATAAALELLDGERSIRAERLRAEAMEQLGRLSDAQSTIDRALRSAARADLQDDPEALTDLAAMQMVRMRVASHGPGDARQVIDRLSQVHQGVDRLYWPALRQEAALLLEKHQRPLAAEALHQALRLNPRDAESWLLLGRLAVQIFDFDGAARAAEALRGLDRDHPFALLLLAESSIVQDDPEQAAELLDVLLDRFPGHPAALALRAAAAACLYDPEQLQAVLAEADRLRPGSPLAWYETGRFLSMFRQYEQAAEKLEEAIRRAPWWTSPEIELGLLEMQSGRDLNALNALRRVIERDPFNKRAANSLALLEELVDYETLETEHFIIRYRPGIDQALIDLMPEALERMHKIVSDRFRMTPSRKTVIEVMPDHERFSVRIVGMPDIHTVAACTGPVIAMEVPREGRRSQHRGLFDWERVLRHEYTHTITLERTRNRIPHWLTEAAAVAMELAPRAYPTAVMLARALEEGTLFPLDRIKWGFVRPRRPDDRAKAYAQSHWMYEFMEQRFGKDAVIDLLQAYFDGARDEQAFRTALGVSPEIFYSRFLEWAREDVRSWGLLSEPSLDDLVEAHRAADPAQRAQMEAARQARLDAVARGIAQSAGRPLEPGERVMQASDWPRPARAPMTIDEQMLASWRAAFPDQPDVLEIDLRRRVERGHDRDDVHRERLIQDLRRLIELRPVADWPHRKLAEIFLAAEAFEEAVPHLEALDAREESSPVFARELSRIYRAQGDLERAYARAHRAVQIDAYRADLRETAAAIAVERRDLRSARRHIRALTLIEPDRAQHQLRLERIDALLAASDG